MSEYISKMKDIIKRLSELNIADIDYEDYDPDIEIAKDLIIEARSMIQLGGLDA